MSVTTQTLSEDGPELPADEELTDLSQDKIFHILQTQRRRDALRYLKRHDGPVVMRELAEQVAAWENDTTVQRLGSDERQRVYIALYQSHLPKLDQEGIIEYDQDRGVVERGPLADQFDPYLDAPAATDDADAEQSQDPDRWLRRYRGATAVGSVLLAATWLTGAVAPNIIGALVVTVFVLLSLAQSFAQ